MGDEVLQEELRETEQEGREEVCPDVDRFIVQVEDGCKACPGAERFGSVAGRDEVVVAVPFGERGPGEELGGAFVVQVDGGGDGAASLVENSVECGSGFAVGEDEGHGVGCWWHRVVASRLAISNLNSSLRYKQMNMYCTSKRDREKPLGTSEVGRELYRISR